MAEVVGAHLEQCGLDLLAHHHAFGGEVGDVHVDGVERRPGRQILLQRHRERDLRGQRPAAGRRLDRRTRILAQPRHPQEFGRGRHRSIEAEADLRRRPLGEGIGYLEHAAGDRELATGRYLHVAAADIDGRRAAGNLHVDVGIADCRQALDRPDLGAVADDLDRQTVIGNRRAARFERGPRRVGRNVQPLDRASLNVIEHPGAHLRRHGDRPNPLHGRDRHARARNSKRQAGIFARKIKAAAERKAEIGVAQLARLEIDALLVGIDPQLQQDAVEHERIGIGRRRGQHQAAAGNFQPPNAAAVARRVELREQGDAAAAGHHLERHHQRLASPIPIETDLGAVDRNAHERVVEIDHDALLHGHPAVEHVRNAIGTDIGADAPRQRQIDLVLIIAPSHGEHRILGRDFLHLDVDDAVAVLARRHRRAHAPRAFDRLRAERNRDAAALGTRHAEIDIGERPLLAIALVVDGEVAILQADLGEVAPVQAAGVEALDPSQQRGEVGNAVACGRARARGRSGWGDRRS